MTTTVKLETPRLILRPPEESDIAALAAIHEEPEVLKYVLGGVSTPGSPEMAWRNVAMLLGHWHLRGYGPWVVLDRSTEEVIGRVGFWFPTGWPGVELSWLIRRSRWGQGLATEAAVEALAWIWRSTEITSVISLVQPDNVRSIRVATKLGQRFRTERVLAGTRLHEYGVDRPAGQHARLATSRPPMM